MHKGMMMDELSAQERNLVIALVSQYIVDLGRLLRSPRVEEIAKNKYRSDMALATQTRDAMMFMKVSP